MKQSLNGLKEFKMSYKRIDFVFSKSALDVVLKTIQSTDQFKEITRDYLSENYRTLSDEVVWDSYGKDGVSILSNSYSMFRQPLSEILDFFVERNLHIPPTEIRLMRTQGRVVKHIDKRRNTSINYYLVNSNSSLIFPDCRVEINDNDCFVFDVTKEHYLEERNQDYRYFFSISVQEKFSEVTKKLSSIGNSNL
jgi:hypothetical protein